MARRQWRTKWFISFKELYPTHFPVQHQAAQATASATAASVVHAEALESWQALLINPTPPPHQLGRAASAVVRQLPDAVQDQVHNLLQAGHVAFMACPIALGRPLDTVSVKQFACSELFFALF